MAKFKITPTTTVAELKEQFRNEVGCVLRVYDGRSEAPDAATLVSLGAKEGELECRTSRTVGKFEEAFQNELNLKVRVYTKDNWVKVLDGITLAVAGQLHNGMTKAQMEGHLSYKRSEKEPAEVVNEVAEKEVDKNCAKEKCPNDLSYKFENCDEEALDLSNWDTSEVTDMHYMFCDSNWLEKINMSGWDTSKVTTMWGMFSGCGSLKNGLDLSSFDTTNVVNMSDMFRDCSSLENLDLSNFCVSKVKTFSSMFFKCRELKTLNLSGWEISNSANTSKMFKGCNSLEKIYINNCNSTTIDKLKEALSEADIELSVLQGFSEPYTKNTVPTQTMAPSIDVNLGWKKTVERVASPESVAVPLHMYGDGFQTKEDVEASAEDYIFFLSDGKSFHAIEKEDWNTVMEWQKENPSFTNIYYFNEYDVEIGMDSSDRERYEDDEEWPSVDRTIDNAIVEAVNEERDYWYPSFNIELIYNGEAIFSFVL